MGIVRVSTSVSLDGYSCRSGRLGRRTRWGSAANGCTAGSSPLPAPRADPADAAVSADLFARTGAVVVGRRTYDIGVDLWGDTPFPVPTFVVTHREHEPRPMTSATFTFVTDGVASAVAQAVTAAGDQDVLVMGGAEIVRQAVGAGVVDEITLNLVPVLLHRGERLLDVDGDAHDRAGPHRSRRDGRGHAPHVPRRALTRPVRRG